MTTVRRSEGSIERKLQNISAVLDLLGVQWINGYKPLAHYQDALVSAVERSLGRVLIIEINWCGLDQCPLCPGSDQILHRSEMTRWATSRHS
jgi:hypothetical protein